LQAMYARFEAEIEQLNERVLERAGERPRAGLLMTHPGVGPITALIRHSNDSFENYASRSCETQQSTLRDPFGFLGRNGPK
jgi:hypothetical protein